MESTLQLRPATTHDAEFVDQLTRTTMGTYVEVTWPDEEAREHYYRINRFECPKTRIICRGGQRVGRLTLTHREGSLFIDNMHVIPEAQGKGIGTWLLEQVIRDAREKKLAVTLTVLKTNPARRLYERLGFQVYGEKNRRLQMRLVV